MRFRHFFFLLLLRAPLVNFFIFISGVFVTGSFFFRVIVVFGRDAVVADLHRRSLFRHFTFAAFFG